MRNSSLRCEWLKPRLKLILRTARWQFPVDVFHRPRQGLSIVVQGAGNPLPRNQNEIEACRQLMLAESKRFAEQSFQAISADRATMLFRDAQSDPRAGQLVDVGENQQVLIAASALTCINSLEISSPAQMLVGPETRVFHACGGAGGLSFAGLGGRFAFRYHNSSPRLAAGKGARNSR